jgi:hypothetical protein
MCTHRIVKQRPYPKNKVMNYDLIYTTIGIYLVQTTLFDNLTLFDIKNNNFVKKN